MGNAFYIFPSYVFSSTRLAAPTSTLSDDNVKQLYSETPMTHDSRHTTRLLSFRHLENLEKRARFSNHDISARTVLFSGGQDSTVALWLLYHTACTRGHSLRTLHYNHMWQDSNFFMADHTTKISFWLNCPHWAVMPTHQTNSEHHASQWRAYMNTRLISNNNTPNVLANGHTRSDQQESGLFSYARMLFGKPIKDVPTPSKAALCNDESAKQACLTGQCITMHRPIAAMHRDETGLLMRILHLPVYPDPTNGACETTRAQLRYIILPLLTKLGF